MSLGKSSQAAERASAEVATQLLPHFSLGSPKSNIILVREGEEGGQNGFLVG